MNSLYDLTVVIYFFTIIKNLDEKGLKVKRLNKYFVFSWSA